MKNILATLTDAYSRADDLDWQEVYDDNLPKVFHYFCYKVASPILAEDLTAMTFEKAWLSRDHFRKEFGQVHAWLMGIARNVASDHFRKKVREVPFEKTPEPYLSSSFDEDVQRRLDFQTIMAILSQFPERERELIAMKYGAELTNREIARLTGLSESNVGTILHRVVNKIRTEWEETHER